MSVNTPTAAKIIDAIYSDFEQWAGTKSGRVYVARDLANAMNVLGQTGSGWIGVIHWEGDEQQGEPINRGPVVANRIRVFLHANMGPTTQADLGLIRTTAARDPFLDVVEAVRYRMLQYTIEGLNSPANRVMYIGTTDRQDVNGVTVAAYGLEFRVYSAIRVPSEQIILKAK